MATHSSTFAREIPWTEEPGGLQSKGSQRVRQDWVTDRNTDTHTATLTISGQEVWETEGGGYVQKQHTHTNSPRNWPRGGLICVILMVFSTVNLQFQGRFAPFSWGQSSELWRLCHGYSLVITQLTYSTWWGFSQDSSQGGQLPGHGSERYLQPSKGIKVSDHAYLLNYYCFVLFDYFPLFMYFLTSLIKHSLWLKFFHRQKADGGHGGEGPSGPAPFHLIHESDYFWLHVTWNHAPCVPLWLLFHSA